MIKGYEIMRLLELCLSRCRIFHCLLLVTGNFFKQPVQHRVV